ncbi:MAG: hypothetical protein MAG458_01209 [Nitrosopumilus sp.]|nr:hypothetical protein [Nitrosopumilus sp.]
MGIQSASEYIDFFINLNMGTEVSLLRFLNNEKLVLKQKLENKNLDKIAIKKGIVILEGLVDETNKLGEEQILKKYQILKK